MAHEFQTQSLNHSHVKTKESHRRRRNWEVLYHALSLGVGGVGHHLEIYSNHEVNK